jgi:hypothetical protein
VLAILALITARMRPLFWSFVVVFNLVGAIDIITGCHLCDPDHLRALVDDHALRRILFVGASAGQQVVGNDTVDPVKTGEMI